MQGLSVIEYDKDAHEEHICQWWKWRHATRMPVELLPNIGVVVTDWEGPACALFLYLTLGKGVCFPEWPVSRPRLGVNASRKAFELALATLEAVAKVHDYNVMICNTMPAIARILGKQGFTFSHETKLTGIKILTN